MAANSTITFWPILGGLLVIGIGGFCVYQYFLKNKEPKKKDTTDVILSELKSKIKYFSGCMNALRDITINPDLSLSKVTFDNIKQVVEVQGTDEIKKWYFNLEKDRNSWDVILYKNKAKEILNILIKCGVHSHEEKEFTWSNEYSKKYNKLSQVQSGQECMVVAPYWIYNGDIFEKGLVKEK